MKPSTLTATLATTASIAADGTPRTGAAAMDGAARISNAPAAQAPARMTTSVRPNATPAATRRAARVWQPIAKVDTMIDTPSSAPSAPNSAGARIRALAIDSP
ncbi:hypothetical protein N867_13635 [Actinotalea fermentans ATCC 43279 = JCM 9966 = DSM 3133]|nr:hypothetical protein N867_13635 [Actinotalea fermentans ATCC 43279 = JCM 9966 = DSM 3133]